MSGAGKGAQLANWPLVGRDDELALARDAVLAGDGVVLTGSPGVGKTRLAREILSAAAAGKRRIEWIAATESAAQVPLGAVAHLVPADALRGERDATLRAIVASLARESEGGVLLGVDDAHLLDPASAALVHLLAATRTASVVVTVRAGKRAPDSIVALWKDGPATVIALQALSRAEMDDVVSTVLGGSVDGSLLHLLWESSGGNSLYLRELVRHGVESGALRRDRALWRWHGELDPDARLQDLVALRIGSVDQSESRALEMVAIGGPLPLGCLQKLGIAEQAERLADRGLLVSSERPTPEFGLAHPLFGEVLRRRMPAARVNRIRLDVANALEATGTGGDAEKFRIALWRCEGGDHTRPAELSAAARRAWVLWSPLVAERLARAALESGPDLEAGYLLGESLSDQGRPHEAVAAFAAVRDLPGSERIRAFAIINLASTLHYHLNRQEEARSHLVEALERTDDPSIRRLILGAMAQLGATGGVANESAEGDVVTPSTQLARTLAQGASGRIDAALRTIADTLAAADDWRDEYPTVGLMLRMTRQWVLMLGGRLAEVDDETTREYTSALAERTDYPRAGWCLLRGMVLVGAGKPRLASTLLHEGLDILGSDDRGWLRPMHAYLSMAMALLGKHAAAEEHGLLAASSNPGIEGVFGVDVQRARGWVRAAGGELSAAVEECQVAASLAAAHDQHALEMLALHDVARFGRADLAAGRLRELAGIVDGALAPAIAAHAEALSTTDGAALEAVSTVFEQLGFVLFAAEASAAASRCHREAGKRTAALASRSRAEALAVAQCDGASTPALDLLTTAPDLTGREREVAHLAAAGLPSRTIAERLGITTRTVDNLLGRVYTKLAISSRSELVELLGR